MNFFTIDTAVVVLSFALVLSAAEDRRTNATEKSTETYDASPRVAMKSPLKPATAASSSEIFKDVVIAAGKNVAIDSTLDYSSASVVAITVQCDGCGTAATALGSTGLVLQARWLATDAESYVATDFRAAT